MIKTDISHLEKLADLMDFRMVIPGTNIRFGLDSLIGLIPGVGWKANRRNVTLLRDHLKGKGINPTPKTAPTY